MIDTIDFVSPLALLLLLLLPPLFIWQRRGAGAGGKRGLLVLSLRATVLTLLVLSLGRPRLVDEVRRLAVAFLVDVSESVPVDERDRALRRIERDLETLPQGDEAELIVFADRPSVEIPFSGLRAREGDAGVVARLDHLESRVNLAESNLARALEFAAGTFPADVAKRIVLVSDGNQTRGDLHSAARALKAAGVRLDVRPIMYRFDEEVIVEGLYAPERGRLGEPVQLRAVIYSITAGSAEIALFDNGAALGDPRRVELDRGANVYRFSPLPNETGVHRYEMVVRASRDGNGANNVGRASVIVGGPPTVIVAAASDYDERIAETLGAAGMQVEPLAPAALPDHPAGYVNADCVVLNNVPAYSLGEDQTRALADAVKELGVGLVVVGGDSCFGPGGYRGTPLEALLPVDIQTTNKKTMPRGALVVVLHSIEFDSGNTWAARICNSAIAGLSPADEAGVVYYHSEKGEIWLFDLAPVGDGRRQRDLIDDVRVGDMPSFQNCFVLAENSLARSDAAVKHIVVISDGDPQAPDPGLLGRLVANRVTISAICIEPHGPTSVPTMKRLARRGGGRYRQLFPSRGDLSLLPRLMLKEAATLRRSALKEEPFVPVTLLSGSPLLRGMGAAWPRLQGYVVTSIRPGAETILLADEENDDPLLAAWHVGLGRAVAFTSDASSRWATDWLAWGKFGPFWSQVVRSAAPTVDAEDFPVHVTADGLDLNVVVDAQDVTGAPLVDIEFLGAALGQGLDPVPFALEQTEAGRYRGTVRVPEQGHYLVRLESDQRGRKGRVLAAAAVDYAPEYRSLSSDEDALAAAALVTGGRALAPDAAPFAHDFAAVRGRVEVWPYLVGLAVLLLILEISARRLDVSFRFALRLPSLRQKTAAAARPVDAGIDVPATAPEPAATREAPRAPPRTDEEPDRAATLGKLRKAKDRATKRREWK